MAAGSRVIMTATWELTEAQYREQLTTRHISPEQFEAHMQRLTQRLACGAEAAAVFVTLGGQIQYSYVSSDGQPIVARYPTTAAKGPAKEQRPLGSKTGHSFGAEIESQNSKREPGYAGT